MRRLLLLIALLAVLFTLRLGAPGFWEKDEARYAQAAREMRRSGDLLVPTLGGEVRLKKPPLAYWLIASAQATLGENELAARLPSALAGIATALFVFLLAKRIAGERAGLLGAIVYATALYPAGMGRLAHPDSLLVLFVTGSLTLFYLAYREGLERRRTIWGAWLMAGLGFLVKGPHAVLIPLLVLAAFLAWRRDIAAFKRFLPGRGILLALAPAVLWGAAVVFREGLPALELWWDETIGRASGAKRFHPKPLWFFLPVVVGGLLPWTLWLPSIVARFRNAKERPRGVLFLLVWAGVVVVFFSLMPNKASGYVLPAAPPLAAAVGVALAGAGGGRALRATGVLHAILLVGLCIAALVAEPKSDFSASPFATAACATLLVLFLAAVSLLAILNRPRAARIAGAAGACVLTLALLSLFAPAANPYHSVRDAGRAVAERIRPGDLFVNMESARAGLLWYADHEVERAATPELAPVWDGPRRIFAFAEPEKIDELAGYGRTVHVLWTLPGRNYLVFKNHPD